MQTAVVFHCCFFIAWHVVGFSILLSEAIELYVVLAYDDVVDEKHTSRIATCNCVCVVLVTTRVHKMTSCRSGKRSFLL